jgi:N-sulfoglucosamine sulfohydrolase
MWPRGIMKPGRVVNDFISFVDLAPTFLEVAGLPWAKSGMAPSPGRSLTDIFRSEKSGQVNPARDFVLVGMERHDIGRPGDAGYPIRGIVTHSSLFLQNFEPTRWPACNPETGYLNVDASPTKSFILDAHRVSLNDIPWALAFGKRPAEELYDLGKDPDCVANLAATDAAKSQIAALKTRLHAELKAQGDPRMAGKGDLFDKYPHANKGHVGFYERFMKGEPLKANWVNPTDFEKKPLD